jgi:hypothetical protein
MGRLLGSSVLVVGASWLLTAACGGTEDDGSLDDGGGMGATAGAPDASGGGEESGSGGNGTALGGGGHGGEGIAACGPTMWGDGTWDHDGDTATPCVEWSDCSTEGAVGLGTATADRQCWPLGWELSYEYRSGDPDYMRDVRLHPSGDVVVLSYYNLYYDEASYDDYEFRVTRSGPSGPVWHTSFGEGLGVDLDAIAPNGDVVVATAPNPTPTISRLAWADGDALWDAQLTDADEVTALSFDDDGNLVVTTGPDPSPSARLLEFSTGDDLGVAEPFVPPEAPEFTAEQQGLIERFEGEVLYPTLNVYHPGFDDLAKGPREVEWFLATNGDLIGTCFGETGGSMWTTANARYIWRVAGPSPEQWTLQVVGEEWEWEKSFWPDDVFIWGVSYESSDHAVFVWVPSTGE